HGRSLERFVALLLISLTSACLFEDLFAFNSCAEDGAVGLPNSTALALKQTIKSEQPSSTDSGDQDHGWFFCCPHWGPWTFFPSRAEFVVFPPRCFPWQQSLICQFVSTVSPTSSLIFRTSRSEASSSNHSH